MEDNENKRQMIYKVKREHKNFYDNLNLFLFNVYAVLNVTIQNQTDRHFLSRYSILQVFCHHMKSQ